MSRKSIKKARVIRKVLNWVKVHPGEFLVEPCLSTLAESVQHLYPDLMKCARILLDQLYIYDFWVPLR